MEDELAVMEMRLTSGDARGEKLTLRQRYENPMKRGGNFRVLVRVWEGAFKRTRGDPANSWGGQPMSSLIGHNRVVEQKRGKGEKPKRPGLN